MSAKLHPIMIRAVCHPIVPIIVVAVGAATNIPRRRRCGAKAQDEASALITHELSQRTNHNRKTRPTRCPRRPRMPVRTKAVGSVVIPRKVNPMPAHIAPKGENPRRSKPVCNRPGDGLGKSPSKKLDRGQRARITSRPPAKGLETWASEIRQRWPQIQSPERPPCTQPKWPPEGPGVCSATCFHSCPLSLFEALSETQSLMPSDRFTSPRTGAFPWPERPRSRLVRRLYASCRRWKRGLTIQLGFEAV